ncbi:MAG: carboxypeptidase-like regulatory domain-containing protein [Gammaproteobacteria bacterium]|nr:carboxypeptidase-like regulatory domain-containing protein [Pseudomonadales bacterium]
MKTSSLLLISVSFLAMQMAAAQLPRTGIVRSAYEHETLPGVSVQVKGKNTGTVTDLDGRYEINAEEDDILVFQLDGFCLFEARAGASQLIDIRLNPNCNLEEILFFSDDAPILNAFAVNKVTVPGEVESANPWNSTDKLSALFPAGLFILASRLDPINANGDPLAAMQVIQLNDTTYEFTQFPSGLIMAVDMEQQVLLLAGAAYGESIHDLGDISTLLISSNTPEQQLLTGSQEEFVDVFALYPELSQPFLSRSTVINSAQTPPEILTTLVEETVTGRDENSETRLRTEIAEINGLLQRAESVEVFNFTSEGEARFLQSIDRTVEIYVDDQLAHAYTESNIAEKPLLTQIEATVRTGSVVLNTGAEYKQVREFTWPSPGVTQDVIKFKPTLTITLGVDARYDTENPERIGVEIIDVSPDGIVHQIIDRESGQLVQLHSYSYQFENFDLDQDNSLNGLDYFILSF